jgi:hypothetical protein
MHPHPPDVNRPKPSRHSPDTRLAGMNQGINQGTRLAGINQDTNQDTRLNGMEQSVTP